MLYNIYYARHNNVELFPEKLSKEDLIMRLIQRGNYVPKSRVTCIHCGSILEITRNDLRNMNDWDLDKCVICCVCDEKIRISEEMVKHLYK